MPTSRTPTAHTDIFAFPFPHARTYDFTRTSTAPHAVRITIPKGSAYRGESGHWHEEYSQLLTCAQGDVHLFWGTGLYESADVFFGAGSSQTIKRWALHSWGRTDQWQTKVSERNNNGKDARAAAPAASGSAPTNESTALLQGDLPAKDDPAMYDEKDHSRADAGQNSAPQPQNDRDDPLIVDLSPSPDYWDQKHAAAHELYHRNLVGVSLDAAIYPALPTTPLPIRLLFALPRFLFPQRLRDRLVAYFLSIQLLVLCAAFDHHPRLGALRVTSWWEVLSGNLIWPEQAPEWICRWQWTDMIVRSHFKVMFWDALGRWVLGMRAVYGEYTPERLRGVAQRGR